MEERIETLTNTLRDCQNKFCKSLEQMKEKETDKYSDSDDNDHNHNDNNTVTYFDYSNSHVLFNDTDTNNEGSTSVNTSQAKSHDYDGAINTKQKTAFKRNLGSISTKSDDKSNDSRVRATVTTTARCRP